MKKILILLLILFEFITIKAQMLSNGFYESENKQSFIYVKNDSILLKINNEDAFGSISLFFGTCKYQKKEIVLNENIVSFKSSKIVENRDKPDSIIKLQGYYINGEPMYNPYFYLISDNSEIYKCGNEDGFAIFYKEELKEFINRDIILKVREFSIDTEHEIFLALGNSYTIQAIIDNFILLTGNIKFKIINKHNIEKVEIKYSNKKIIFNKINSKEYNLEDVFNKMITSGY